MQRSAITRLTLLELTVLRLSEPRLSEPYLNRPKLSKRKLNLHESKGNMHMPEISIHGQGIIMHWQMLGY